MAFERDALEAAVGEDFSATDGTTESKVVAIREGVVMPATGFMERFENRYPKRVVDLLLQDHSTGGNIIWATTEHEDRGEGFAFSDQITYEKVFGSNTGVVKPRLAKAANSQVARTRSRAEVFTPSWVVNVMNNHIDRQWFRRDVFTTETENGWSPIEPKVVFPKTRGRGWQAYVRSPRLEITCGEAPFVCTRYDTVDGSMLPVEMRTGFLDRKLRVVSERAKDPAQWNVWALEALKATYGYEYQGDNLLIARVNVMESYVEHYVSRWGEGPAEADVASAANVVSWNFWQMDGRTGSVPGAESTGEEQPTLFSFGDIGSTDDPFQGSLFETELGDSWESSSETPLKLYDWANDRAETFAWLHDRAAGDEDMKKFFAIVGNPPFQKDVVGNQRSTPIYSAFMDSAYQVADRVELITPARFLFNAGQTARDWNRKMLADPHLKVLWYEPDGKKVFPDQEIKGGVAVTYRDETQDFGPIGLFIPDEEVKSALQKVSDVGETTLDTVFIGAVPYKFSDRLRAERPDLLSTIGSSFDLRTNIFDKLDNVLFFEKRPDAGDPIAIFGLVNKQRDYRWVDRGYVEVPENFTGYKVLMPKAFGKGAFGEKLPEMAVVGPNVGHTQTFVSIGNFPTEEEARALEKYLKTKFARSMLGILKVTQDVTARVWAKTPLQDFSPSSDIDWSRPIADVDRQLYAKYGLSDEEIEFIETHVKEMD